MTDHPTHFPASPDPHREPGAKVPLYVTQSTMDGLYALLQWLAGYKSAKGGEVPGGFELIMHYRALRAEIEALEKKP